MFRKDGDKNHHNKLLQHIRSLNLIAEDEGVCFGYSAMAIQAILLRDTVSFDTRQFVLDRVSADELTSYVQASFMPRSQVRDESSQQFYHDMQAFLSGVCLYQNAIPYRYLFKTDPLHLKQGIEKAAALILPQEIMDHGGLEEAGRFYSVYEHAELAPLFESLRAELRNHHLDYSIAFLFRSSNHALTVGFDPSINKWIYIEVHEGPGKYLDDAQLADMINHAFSRNTNTAVSVTAYTLGDNAEQTRHILDKWKTSKEYIDSHAPSVRRIKAEDSYHTTLLYLCVVNNDIKRLSTLLKSSHINVNQKTDDGYNALYYATMYGLAECVQLLIQHPEIDPNICRSSGVTPLHVAAYGGRMDIMVELLKHKKIDVNKEGVNGMAALHYAVQENRIDCVRTLLEHPGIDIDKINLKDATPLMVAAAHNYLRMIELILAKFPETANTSVGGYTALKIAESLSHLRAAKMLRACMLPQHQVMPQP